MEIFEAPIDSGELPAAAGSYVLEFELVSTLTLRPGRLGTVRLGPGRVRYYGSARGPGGLRARVTRHLRDTKPEHWHVDALTARAPVARVLIDRERTEHALVNDDLESAGFRVAVPGFGSSDCVSCPAHLLIERWFCPTSPAGRSHPLGWAAPTFMRRPCYS